MKKTISYAQFQSVKAIAKACNDPMRRRAAAQEKIQKLLEECKEYDNQIESIGAGVFQMTGFHVDDWVKRIEEPTGKFNEKTGKPLTTIKFVPAKAVSYDEKTRQFTLELPDADAPVVPPTTEDGPGSDYDVDEENVVEESSEEIEEGEFEEVEDNEMDDIFG